MQLACGEEGGAGYLPGVPPGNHESAKEKAHFHFARFTEVHSSVLARAPHSLGGMGLVEVRLV